MAGQKPDAGATKGFKAELLAAAALTQLSQEEREKLRSLGHFGAEEIISAAGATGGFALSSFSDQKTKKNFAENLSRLLGSRFARALRPAFPGILPDEGGKGHESKARTSKGYKKLDVNYSTPELGLGLGVSIKTINARDNASKRFSKNLTRVDAELRAEAADYHERQPFAVMVAVIFLPMEACFDDTPRAPSTFGSAVRMFRNRAGRVKPTDSHMLFEQAFVGLYENDESKSNFGEMVFLNVETAPPARGVPMGALNFSDVISEITTIYDGRNAPAFTWADQAIESPSDISEQGDDEA